MALCFFLFCFFFSIFSIYYATSVPMCLWMWMPRSALEICFAFSEFGFEIIRNLYIFLRFATFCSTTTTGRNRRNSNKCLWLISFSCFSFMVFMVCARILSNITTSLFSFFSYLRARSPHTFPCQIIYCDTRTLCALLLFDAHSNL